jgi:hypothetical protein
MKTTISLVLAGGLLIGSAAIGYGQQAATPQGGTVSGPAAQFGSKPSAGAQFSVPNAGSTAGEPAVSNNPSSATRNSNGQTIGSGVVVGPSNNGVGVLERRDRTMTRNNNNERIIAPQNDLTTGRADRGVCTTQTYQVPSEATGDLTPINITRC